MPKWFRVLGWRIRGIFGRHRLDEEFRQELDAHLEMLTEENIRRGMPPEKARRAARVRLGGLTQLRETHREMWGLPWLETLLQDLRYGLRQLRRNPGFTAVAVITLALGIAANTTIFSAVSAILLRKPPVKNPDHLCAVSSKNLVRGYNLQPISVPDFESWKTENNVFADMAAIESGHSFTVTGKGEPESIDGDLVTPDYFKVTGLTPVLGCAFLPNEGQAGSDHVVILSNALWHAKFDANPGVIWKTINIDFVPYTIIGVMPAKADIPLPWRSPRIWVPLAFTSKDLSPSSRGNRDLNMVLGRLKPGVAVQQAQVEFSSIAGRLARSYPQADKGWGIAVLTLQEYLIRKPQTRAALTLLIVMVGVVLLIACANIAGLLLARGSNRSHEMAVRCAVGASRARLIRQMLAESLLIGMAGGATGLLMSAWGIGLLRAGFNFNEIGAQVARSIHLDHRTLVFTITVSLLTTVIFGLVPAIRTSGISPRDALAEGGRPDSGSFAHTRLRSIFVTGELALAVALFAGAGLIMRDVAREYSVNKGFNPHDVLVMASHLKNRIYQTPEAQIAFVQKVAQRLRSAPGVRAASVTNCVPLGCQWSTSFTIPGQPPLEKSKRPSAGYFSVGPGYFRTMQIPLIKGREFSDSDNVHAPVVAVVNQEFARRFYPKGNAIGEQIEVDTGHRKAAQIVGIVGNVSEYVGELSPRPQIYESYLQIPFPDLAFVLRSPVEPSALAPVLRSGVWSVDKDQPIGRIQTMNDLVADNVGGDELMVALMGIFAGLALTLSAIGIYGVVAYSVSQRTREIGIRMALGAEKKDVLRLVFRQGGLLAGIGCSIGLALALPLPHVLAGIFPGFSSQGPFAAVAVFFFAGVVCLVATYFPARRAARVEPIVALRYE